MQFNLFSLFVFTTVAAIGCAIARLPIDPVAKACPIFALIVCYYGWAVRNHKYPNPRRQPQLPPSRTRRMLQVCIDASIYAMVLFSNNQTSRQFSLQLLWYAMALGFPGLLGFRVWYALKPDPKSLATQLT
jgi:hypothetical protein